MARNRYTKTREQMMQMGLNAMTPEQQFEARSRGGKVRAASNRRMKHMQQIAKAILSMRLQSEEEIRTVLHEGGFEDEDINYAAGIIMAQTLKAVSGDTKAAEFVRDTSGQKPVDGLVIGNLEDRPFQTLDLASLTDEQLQELVAAKSEKEEE